jgi:hypothetical protein
MGGIQILGSLAVEISEDLKNLIKKHAVVTIT